MYKGPMYHVYFLNKKVSLKADLQLNYLMIQFLHCLNLVEDQQCKSSTYH